MHWKRGIANEKEEKLSRIKEWRRKNQEKNIYRLKNLNYNEKNCNKRIEFAREKWRCDLQVVKRDRKSVFRVPVDLNEEILASM